MNYAPFMRGFSPPLTAPLRVRNLASLDLVEHIVRTANGRRVSVVIAGHEVKNREDLDYPLPEPSVALLDFYLTRHRPVLAPAGNTALFPGRFGGAKGSQVLGRQISSTIKRYTGLDIHPHLFRHIAAKLYLDAYPGSYEVVRRVLGHRSIDTTTTFYTGLETAAAVRHFDAAILKLRQAPRAP
jgi:integrase